MPFQPDALDADTLRKLAKRLRRAITDHLNVPVATHQSQAILAQAFSFPDWHGAITASGAHASPEAPPAQTVPKGSNPLLTASTADVLTVVSTLVHFGDWDHELDLATWRPLIQTLDTLAWTGPAALMRELLARVVGQGTEPPPVIPVLVLTWVRAWLTQTHTRVTFFNRRHHLSHRTIRAELGDILLNLWHANEFKAFLDSGAQDSKIPFIHVRGQPRRDSAAMFIAVFTAIQADPSLLDQDSEQALLLALRARLTAEPPLPETSEADRQAALQALDNYAQRSFIVPTHPIPKVNHLFITLVHEGWMGHMASGHLMALYLGQRETSFSNTFDKGTLESADWINQWNANTTWAYAAQAAQQLAILAPHQQLALLEGLVQTLDRHLPDPTDLNDDAPPERQTFWQDTLQQAAQLFDRLDEMDLFMVCQRWQAISEAQVLDHLLAQCRQVDLRLALAFERGTDRSDLPLAFRVLYGLEAARAHSDPTRPSGLRLRIAKSISTFADLTRQATPRQQTAQRSGLFNGDSNS